MIDSPHSKAQEGLAERATIHSILILLIKPNFFLKIFDCIFAGINQYKEILPKIMIVLNSSE